MFSALSIIRLLRHKGEHSGSILLTMKQQGARIQRIIVFTLHGMLLLTTTLTLGQFGLILIYHAIGRTNRIGQHRQ